MLFRDGEEMPAAVRTYFRSVAGESPQEQYAERLWLLPPTYRLG